MSEGTEVVDESCGHEGCTYPDGTRREATLSIQANIYFYRCGNHAAELIRSLSGPLIVRRVEQLRIVNAMHEHARLKRHVIDTVRRMRNDGATPRVIGELDTALRELERFENA